MEAVRVNAGTAKQVLPELDIWHCEALRMNPETLRLTPRIVRLLVSVPNVS